MPDRLCAPAPRRVVNATRDLCAALADLRNATEELDRLDPRLTPRYFTGRDHLRAATTATELAYRSLLAVDPTDSATPLLDEFFTYPGSYLPPSRD